MEPSDDAERMRDAADSTWAALRRWGHGDPSLAFWARLTWGACCSYAEPNLSELRAWPRTVSQLLNG